MSDRREPGERASFQRMHEAAHELLAATAHVPIGATEGGDSSANSAPTDTTPSEVRTTRNCADRSEYGKFRGVSEDQQLKHIIAHNIKLALEEAGMTQGELGRRTGKAPHHVSDWCRAVHKPGPTNLHKIAAEFGLPYHWFLVDRRNVPQTRDRVA